MDFENSSASQFNCDATMNSSTRQTPSTPSSATSALYRTNNVSKIVSTLQTSFIESQKHEQRVRRRLARQVDQTNALANRLKEEQSKNARLCREMRIDGLSAESSCSESNNRDANKIPPGAFHDIRHSMSPMLMQYKYIEILNVC